VGQDAPLLEPLAVHALLERLASVADEIVLIGGQALNFWAERYMAHVPDLAAAAPYTSKDIDFYGPREQVAKCARLLGVEPTFYGPDDISVCSGIVTTADGIQIDFVHTPKGVPLGELRSRSVAFSHLRVMHPVHVMSSRVANVVELGRTDPNSLKQLRASVFIVREFIMRDVLDAGRVKAAQRLCEQVFDVSTATNGLSVWRDHAVDLFGAVSPHPDLGSKFAEIRYPQMQARLAHLRAHHA
jgi:hypothetical protein